MKKISRRNFLLASGVVTVGAALAACGGGSSSTTRTASPFNSSCCFLCRSCILCSCFCSGCCRGQGAEHLVLE